MVHKNVALVLGGGGSAGHAWTIGVIAGLAEAGIDMTEAADLVIGTSSGATAAAQVRSGIPPAELLASILSQPVPPVGQNRPAATGPADGHGVRADEGHRRCRHLGSRSATCDGRVRLGERRHPRTRRGRTLARNGRRQVGSPAMAGQADDRHGRQCAYRRVGRVRSRFRRRSRGRSDGSHRAAGRGSYTQHQRHTLYQRWRALRRKRRPRHGLCERRGDLAVWRTDRDHYRQASSRVCADSRARTWKARSRPCASRAAASR